jgi:hypothetical protein
MIRHLKLLGEEYFDLLHLYRWPSVDRILKSIRCSFTARAAKMVKK